MKKIFCLSLFILLSSCVANNKYQSFNGDVGYVSERSDRNVYTVTYTGTRSTKTEKINDFALLRCAELTLEKGFKYFVITEATNNRADIANANSVNLGEMLGRGTRIGAPGGNRFNTDVSPSVSSNGRPQSKLEIHMFNDRPDTVAYDAMLIGQALKREYEISNDT